MPDALRADTVTIAGFGGDEIEAYLAQPGNGARVGGVVVIHHMPGYDEATKEITRRFAAQGYLAVCPNLYTREALGASSDDAAATARSRGGVPDERLVGDVAGAINFMRTLPSSNGKFATIGYCSGGRQSFLAACSLQLDAAVDCYGGLVVGTRQEGSLSMAGPIGHLAKNLSCPLLGLFGVEDKRPSPEDVAELESLLRRQDKEFEFHSYQGAGHGFFAVDRPGYRYDAANDGWQRIWEFFGRHLAT